MATRVFRQLILLCYTINSDIIGYVYLCHIVTDSQSITVMLLIEQSILVLSNQILNLNNICHQWCGVSVCTYVQHHTLDEYFRMRCVTPVGPWLGEQHWKLY